MANESTEITSKDVIRGIDVFSDFDDEIIQEKLRFAQKKVVKDGIDKDIQEQAILAYARYLLSLTYFASNGGVTSATTLGQSFQNIDWSKENPFLDEYNQIVDDFGNGGWTARFL